MCPAGRKSPWSRKAIKNLTGRCLPHRHPDCNTHTPLLLRTHTLSPHTPVLQIQLWDTAGIERFATMAASYYQGAHAAVLCYAINDRSSFNMLSQHIIGESARGTVESA